MRLDSGGTMAKVALWYNATSSGLSVAPATWQRFSDRAHRLYEQERGKPEGSPRLGAYVQYTTERRARATATALLSVKSTLYRRKLLSGRGGSIHTHPLPIRTRWRR